MVKSSYCSEVFFIRQKWGSLTDMIIDSLNLNNYVYLYVDRFHIKKYQGYKRKSLWHEIFIYGYDTERKVFLVADNLLEGKYIRTECSFNEVELGYSAINSNNHFFLNIHLLSVKDEKEFTIKVPQIIMSIDNYLNSSNSIDVSFKENVIFGRNVILHYAKRISQENEDKFLDRRAFHLFWEHKNLMLKRLLHLQKVYIDINNELIENYKCVENNFLIIRNMTLKYNLTKNKSLLPRIHYEIINNLNREQDILCKLTASVNYEY